MSICKGCSASVHVQGDQIEAMLNKMAASGNFELVPDAVYDERLAACRVCPSFQYGTTCLHCGCIMQVKAKMTGSSCPYPGKSKWKSMHT